MVKLQPSIAGGCFIAESSPGDYALMRRVLVAMSQLGKIKISLLSEMLVNRSQPNYILDDYPRCGNSVQIVAWKSGAKTPPEIKGLATTVANELKQFGLQVVVQL